MIIRRWGAIQNVQLMATLMVFFMGNIDRNNLYNDPDMIPSVYIDA